MRKDREKGNGIFGKEGKKERKKEEMEGNNSTTRPPFESS